ncbi:MAG: aminoacyl-tRNA hydrolase [Ruminococcaceae bacterium]|nr:aminoacyl-tRNA hydrolase [Oscillospiraceae bacterium]
MADIFELFKKIGSQTTTSGGTPEYIIAGLGNPGDKYLTTRHNAGFMAMDYLSQKLSAPIRQIKFKSVVGNAVIGGKNVLLMKPQTYMNLSGEAVGEAAKFYKIAPERIIILVDDTALAPGRMRLRKGGSAGGHNGLKSLIEHLGTEEFPRVRLGVGEKPHKEYDMADWVLGKMSDADLKLLFQCLEASLPACELIMDGKMDEAMGKFNGFKAE